MTVEIRRATPDDLEELIAMDFRNFGVGLLPKDADLPEGLLEPDRFLVAVDGGQIVAAGGSYEMELTVPGGGTVPMSGVTWVSVVATHRRQGLLRRLMGGLDQMAVEFGEPLLGLTASEGSIYERFGYGVSTKRRVIEIDRRRAQIEPGLEPESVQLIDAAEHIDDLMALFDRYRTTQVGEVSRTKPVMIDHNINPKQPNYAAIHDDGYAVWATKPDWQDGHPNHSLFVKDLIAVTDAAYVALWNVLLSTDLVGPIRSHGAVGLDDPLPFLLTDQRALRTTDLNDGLWLKVTDPVACFSARTYRADDQLVVGITDDSRIAVDAEPKPDVSISVSPDGVAETDEQPDLVVTRAGLGPLLVGGSASIQASGGTLVADGPILDRADVLFGTGTAAHCRTGF